MYSIRPMLFRFHHHHPHICVKPFILACSSSTNNNNSSTSPPPPSSIPTQAIQWRFVRSSGPGGQNVNKLNTACEARFHVQTAEWLPVQVRERMAKQETNRINSLGELIVTSQEERTQQRNKDRCAAKILQMVHTAWHEPKIRVVQIDPPQETKERWKLEKRAKSAMKKQKHDFDY